MIRSHGWRWPLLAALAVALPRASRGQGVITLRAGTEPTLRAAPGEKFVVPVVADLAAASGLDIAALTARIAWNPVIANLDSITGGGFGSVTPNVGTAGKGLATFSVFSVNGATHTVTVARLFFTARQVIGQSDIALIPTVAGTESGRAVLSQVRSRALTLCVSTAPSPCPATRPHSADGAARPD